MSVDNLQNIINVHLPECMHKIFDVFWKLFLSLNLIFGLFKCKFGFFETFRVFIVTFWQRKYFISDARDIPSIALFILISCDISFMIVARVCSVSTDLYICKLSLPIMIFHQLWVYFVNEVFFRTSFDVWKKNRIFQNKYVLILLYLLSYDIPPEMEIIPIKYMVYHLKTMHMDQHKLLVSYK